MSQFVKRRTPSQLFPYGFFDFSLGKLFYSTPLNDPIWRTLQPYLKQQNQNNFISTNLKQDSDVILTPFNPHHGSHLFQYLLKT